MSAPLSSIAHAVGGTIAGGPDPLERGGLEISDVVHDSRQATAGALFVAVRGATTDGHDHAVGAVDRGVSALMVERVLDLPVPQIVVGDARAAMAQAAATCWGHPSRSLIVVGVTGTNGKTSTTHLVGGALEALGVPTAVVGTLTGARTTPEATDLQRRLATEVAAGTEAVVMEVSSHALELHRADAIAFDRAGFTNLSRDHLGFHGSMEAYFEAKSRLFEANRTATGVVNTDDEWGERLAASAGCPVITVDRTHATRVVVGADSVAFSWRGRRVELAMGGAFNVDNGLLAAELLVSLGHDDGEVARALATVPPVAGRFEPIDAGQDFAVVVDFAHTPDGLERTLATARQVTRSARGRVIVVFGCGGDRDASKREPMGRIASEMADVMVVTNDNPRSESPSAIISDVLSGATGPAQVLVEEDREAAIGLALSDARNGDMVIIAGKGHEQTQTIGDSVVPFDDASVARGALIRLSELPAGEALS